MPIINKKSWKILSGNELQVISPYPTVVNAANKIYIEHILYIFKFSHV